MTVAARRAPRRPSGLERCGADREHGAHVWHDGDADEADRRCDGGVDPDLCPRCGQEVDPDGENMQAPVLWDGLLVHGHAGCLADVQHERRRP